ncbi:hypothetical protein GCM10009678_77970 [Actinomadura kijaniata]|uniref:Uncharacterized protein n=1 Tax=Actinomadura namibiensis TaxID=182080 RepID=A0A7W3LVL1_ACTNM|nr:hypothetical protein [Actinomadura namibiensis]MBA8955022.1 hypothetical protein [Actinomadura namibiensis]
MDGQSPYARIMGTLVLGGAMSAVVFFQKGQVPLGVLGALVAAAALGHMVVSAVAARRRWREEMGGTAASPYAADPRVRSAARDAAPASGAFGACVAVLTLLLAMSAAGSGGLEWLLIVALLPAMMSVSLLTAAVRMAKYQVYGVASAMHTFHIVFVVGAILAFSLLGKQWLIAGGDAVAMLAAAGAYRLLVRAERALGGPSPAPAGPGRIG